MCLSGGDTTSEDKTTDSTLFDRVSSSSQHHNRAPGTSQTSLPALVRRITFFVPFFPETYLIKNVANSNLPSSFLYASIAVPVSFLGAPR